MILGLAALTGLAALIASLERSVALDAWVWRHVLLMRGCATDALVDRIVDDATRGLTLLLIVAAAVHVRTRGWRSAWPWVSTCVLGIIASKTMKHVFTRERPSSLPDVALGYSFPSAHAMNSIAAFIAIVALAYGFRRQRFWWLAAAVPTATVAAGRIVLGHHWACDVIGGALAAVALTSLVVPAVSRRPMMAPTILALVLLTTLLVDHRLGDAGLRLPTPLVGSRAALIDVDVGTNPDAELGGTWQERDEQHPGGSFRWLAERGTVAIDVSDALVDSPEHAAAALQLAFGGRTEKPRPACMAVTVEINQRALGRFVPFDGWREYRLPVPRGLLHAGRNEVAVSVTVPSGPARFALSYLRIAASAGGDQGHRGAGTYDGRPPP